MQLTPQTQKRRTAQFYNCYVPVFTDGTHATEFDGETLPSLYDKLGEKILAGKSVKNLAQAIHNIYAKKLSIAPVRVMKKNDLESPAAFNIIEFLTGKNKTVIMYNGESLQGGPATLIDALIHETKHAQQAYNVNNYIRFGIIPKSDNEKLLLLYEFFWNYGFTFCYKLPYYSGLQEIDAYFYEFKEMQKLNKRYPEKFNGFTYYCLLWEKASIYLSDFDYNKNGLNSKGLKKIYKAVKKDIYNSLHGDYGKEMKELCSQIFASGFNLEKAFDSIIEELDYMYSQTELLAYNVRDLGLKAKFEKKGNLIYSTKKASAINKNYMNSNLYKTFMYLSNEVDDKFLFEKQK